MRKSLDARAYGKLGPKKLLPTEQPFSTFDEMTHVDPLPSTTRQQMSMKSIAQRVDEQLLEESFTGC